jgi:hypothetical protein
MGIWPPSSLWHRAAVLSKSLDLRVEVPVDTESHVVTWLSKWPERHRDWCDKGHVSCVRSTTDWMSRLAG